MIQSSHVSFLRQPSVHLVVEALANRWKRSAEHASDPVIPPEATGASAQSKGDSELAGLLAQALRTGATTGQLGNIDGIPPASSFGQWWSHLHNLMQSPHFVTWAASQGIDLSKPIEITPRSHSIGAMVGGARKVFSGFELGYLWTSMMAPIMQAATALTSGSGYIYSPTRSTSAPYRSVADFYGEPINAQPRDVVAARAMALEQSRAFDAPRLRPERSEELLHCEQAKLAVVHDQRAVAMKLIGTILLVDELSDALMYRTTLQPTDALYLRPEDVNTRLEHLIHGELSKACITLHPDSPSRALQEGATISLDKYLGDNGLEVPKSREELLNLGRTLTTPLLVRPPYADFGGGLSWPVPLSDESLRDIRDALTQNHLGIDDLHSYNEGEGVLGYLTGNQRFAPAQLHDPARFVEDLLATPKAQALGLALQERFNGVSTPESINDWTLAALGTTLDRASETGSPSAPVRTVVAGFDLARQDHWGVPPSTVVSQLARHLFNTGRTHRDLAPIAAHLLLLRRAPAFLVKAIPEQVTYGSHSWVSFSTAVARLESQAPGSAARMTYAQVMQRADLAPVTEQERQVERMAQRDALKDWGVANGVIPLNTQGDYTNEQMSCVFSAFEAQIAELSAASKAYSTAMPVRKEMALEALERIYGDQIPVEEKCLATVPELRDFPGPYSVLDLYLSGSLSNPPGIDWRSSRADVNLRRLQRDAGRLPAINERFRSELPKYFASMEKATGAQVKNLIAMLPVGDRENIEYGKITTLEEYLVTQGGYSREVTETKVPNRLLVKTVRDDVVTVYAINLKENSICKRDELRDYPSGPRTYSDGHTRYQTMLKEIEPVGSYSSDVTDGKPQTGTPHSFASEKTRYIADAMVKTVGIRDLEVEATGMTTFDTEVPFYKKAREFMLNMIPLRSAIQNVGAGNIGEGIVDLTFDSFGFALGFGVAAKGANAFQTGARAVSKLANGVKIIGRAALGSLNPLSGVDDLARGVFREGRNAFRSVRKVLTKVDTASPSNIPGVAEGTLKAADAVGDVRLFAKFEDATGYWHPLNLHTKQPYGMPLQSFKPDAVPVETLRNNLQTLHDKLGGGNRTYMLRKSIVCRPGR